MRLIEYVANALEEPWGYKGKTTRPDPCESLAAFGGQAPGLHTQTLAQSTYPEGKKILCI